MIIILNLIIVFIFLDKKTISEVKLNGEIKHKRGIRNHEGKTKNFILLIFFKEKRKKGEMVMNMVNLM